MQTSNKRNCLRFLLALVVASNVLWVTAVRALNDTNEVWISATNSLSKLGSLSIYNTGPITNPYWGDFDAIMNSIPANSTIHLLPGIFYSNGQYPDTNISLYPGAGLVLKPGQKIVGAGRDTTVVRNVNPSNEVNRCLFRSDYDGIEMTDFTIDAGFDGTELGYRQGVQLGQNNCSLLRIKVINTAGFAGETFPIIVGLDGGTNSLIDDCEVSSAYGPKISAICLNGQGIVRNSRVSFPVQTNNYYSTSDIALQGFCGGRFNGAIFDGNTCDGGTVGFYSEGAGVTNLSIINNHFTRCHSGIVLVGYDLPEGVYDGINIRNNVIELSRLTYTNMTTASGIHISSADVYRQYLFRNVSISGNTLQYYGDGARLTSADSIIVYNISPPFSLATNLYNVRIWDNTIERDFVTHTYTALGFGNWFAGNTDQTGNPYDFLRISGSATETLHQLVEKVQVTSSSTATNIQFEFGWGYAGKEITVINQKPSSSITVLAVSGESISGSATVSTNQTAVFMADGLGTWTREEY